MTESSSIIICVGLVAQFCFAIRQLIQWYASEKAQTIQSPISFWTFSLLGSVFFFFYGILREDFAIVIGQFFNFYIYCRNLHFKGVWDKFSKFIQLAILSIPILVLAFVYCYRVDMFYNILDNDAINGYWAIIGTLGYLLFTLRFFYQWYISEKIKSSKLPVGFFVLSIIGSVLIISYGLYRGDMILVLGYLGGMVVYIRNLMIHRKSQH